MRSVLAGRGRPPDRRWLLPRGLLVAALALAGCGAPPAPPPDVPDPDTAGMEPQVRVAIRQAREAVLAEPDSAATWGKLGMILDVHEIDAGALAAYRRAEELDPQDPRWPYFQGRLLAIGGTDLPAAVVRLRRALELKPSYAPGHLRLADVLVRQGELGPAEASYRRCLALDVSLAKAHLGLGQVALAGGRTAEAVEHLERARELAPGDGTALAALSQAYLRAGDRGRAEEAAGRARELPRVDTYPDPLLAEVAALGVSSNIALDRAVGLLAAGRPAEAVTELKKVVAARPDDPHVHVALAGAYRDAGQPAAAIPHLARAVELEEGLLDARLELGLLLVAAGRGEEALPHLHRAVAGAEERGGERAVAVHQGIGRALVQGGDLAAAEAAFGTAAGFGPLPAEALNDWGSTLAQQGRFAEAVGRFEEALAAEPGNARAHVNLGLAHEGLGRPREALAWYLKALEIQPDPLAANRVQALTGRPPPR